MPGMIEAIVESFTNQRTTVLHKILYKLRRLLFKVSPRLAEALGVSFPYRSEDRRFLENEVFRFLNARHSDTSKSSKLLFIGLDKHNWHYPRLLDLEFHTIDLDPRNARYARKGLHTVGTATQLGEYYKPASFDVVIANGMVGFGINSLDAFDAMIHGVARVLKPGGLLVLGYSKLPDRVHFELDQASALKPFRAERPDIPMMSGPQHLIPNEFQHVYWFMSKA